MRKETLEITAFAFGGRGIGRSADGKVCFVDGAAPGEKAKCAFATEKKNYRECVLEAIETPSAHRIAPQCPTPCPGCAYTFVDYAFELEWKQRQFESFAARLKNAKFAKIDPPAASPERFFWRNKIKFALQDGKTGYRAADNVSFAPVSQCMLGVREINEAAASGEWRKDMPPDAKSVTFRFTKHDGALWHFDAGKRDSRLVTEYDSASGLTFKAPLNSFFQVNVFCAPLLTKRVMELAAGCGDAKLFVELYCGVGVFSVLYAKMTNGGTPCRGIEYDARSTECAGKNAVAAGFGGICRFYAGDAGLVLRRLFGRGMPARSILLLDPPRTGIERKTVDTIIRLRPESIIYVSCAPDTLMRDLELFGRGGYSPERGGIIDMFPGTAHFESVVLLKRL